MYMSLSQSYTQHFTMCSWHLLMAALVERSVFPNARRECLKQQFSFLLLVNFHILFSLQELQQFTLKQVMLFKFSWKYFLHMQELKKKKMICMSLAEISSETANGFLTSQLYPRNVPAFTIPNHCSNGLTQDRQAAVLLPMK